MIYSLCSERRRRRRRHAEERQTIGGEARRGQSLLVSLPSWVTIDHRRRHRATPRNATAPPSLTSLITLLCPTLWLLLCPALFAHLCVRTFRVCFICQAKGSNMVPRERNTPAIPPRPTEEVWKRFNSAVCSLTCASDYTSALAVHWCFSSTV